jgi:hypothetical protein
VAARCESALCLYPLAGGQPRRIADSERMIPVGWQGPRVLIARSASPIPARLFRLDITTGRRTPWRELAPPDASGVRRINSVSVAADGESYSYSFTRQVSDLYAVTGLH